MSVAQDRFERHAVSRTASRRRWLYGLCGAGAVLAIGIVTWHFAAPSKPVAPAAKPAPSLTVTAASPHRVQWAETLETSGAIAAWQEAIIGSQIGGYQLVDIRVNVGDQVKKGQVLARFDSDLLSADAAQLQAGYDQAAANEKRALALRDSGAMAEQNVLLAVTTAKTALAQLEAKKLQLRYTNVVAPDDGAISSRTATLGAVLPIGQELFRLIRQNRLEWRGELTAAQIGHIAIGQRITLTLPDGTAAAATVRQIAPGAGRPGAVGGGARRAQLCLQADG
jgi:RND family efflux transporter MFP subunit